MDLAVILVALISTGVMVVIQGALILKRRREGRVSFFERPLVDALSPKSDVQLNQLLGRLRLVYGFFLVLLGIWALIS